MITLRPDDQLPAVENIRASFAKHRRVLLCAPTGFGKTQVAAYCASNAVAKRKTVWLICHRDYLLEQTSKTFDAHGLVHSFIAAGRSYNEWCQVHICLIDTLARRLDRLTPPDLIIADEAHRGVSPTWAKVLDWAYSSRVLGLSASPQRLDGKGLDKQFDDLVLGPPVAWLIQQGFLSRYRAFAPTKPNLDGVHTRAGDYALEEISAIMDTNVIVGDLVTHYKKYAAGLRGLYFGVSIEHSQHIAAAFNANGVPAAHMDGTTPSGERTRIAKMLASGEINVISNVNLATEGYDLAAQAGEDVTIECVGLARPTQSLTLYLQAVGRALRPKDDPAIILDHANCVMTHGLPDADREWSLKGRSAEKRKSDSGAHVAQCKNCFGVFGASARVCPYCGDAREIDARQVEEIAGELVEIDHATIAEEKEARKQRERQEQFEAKTTAELIQLGRKRGYRNPSFWAINVMKSRGART